jgi:LCP family protein required for cell wall assembly
MSARSEGGRLRRTWPQRLLICFNVCCIGFALVAAALVAYAKETVAQIPRVTISGPGVKPVADLAPGAPQNFLIVGVDDATGLAEDDPAGDDRPPGLRSDTIMVVRIDPKEEEARILSFPRDLWVDIPGQGPNRINSAIQYGTDGGVNLLIATLKENFNIDINHYVQVNFAGFKNVISQIGGVPVYLSNPVRDGNSGLFQPQAGCVTLDEDQALAYARSRNLQYQEDGRWQLDPSVDFGRISRQQDFTRRVLKRAIERGARNPATLRRMVESGVTSIRLDQYTTAGDLITLGRTFRDYDPDELITYSLPVTDAIRDGGAKVLDLIPGESEPILALFRGTGSAGGSATVVVPGSVTVRVLNGTGIQNQGADTTDQFAAAGFKVRSPGNDTAMRYARTEVRYRPGQEAQAVLVARYLGTNGSPVLIPDDEVPEITVVTGDDLLAVVATPRAVDQIATTTAPPVPAATSTTVPGAAGSGATLPGAPTAPEIAAEATTTPADPGVPVTEPKGYLPGTPPVGVPCG